MYISKRKAKKYEINIVDYKKVQSKNLLLSQARGCEMFNLKKIWKIKKFFLKIPYPHGRGINNKVKIIIVKKQPI